MWGGGWGGWFRGGGLSERKFSRLLRRLAVGVAGVGGRLGEGGGERCFS